MYEASIAMSPPSRRGGTVVSCITFVRCAYVESVHWRVFSVLLPNQKQNYVFFVKLESDALEGTTLDLDIFCTTIGRR